MRWARDVLAGGWKIQYEPSSVAFHSHDYSYPEQFFRAFDDGVGNREAFGTRFASRDVTAVVESMVRDDWRYLSEGWGLAGEELERARAHAVLKRAMWMTGHWLGTHHGEIGDTVDSLWAFMLAEGLAPAGTDGTSAGLPSDDELIDATVRDLRADDSQALVSAMRAARRVAVQAATASRNDADGRMEERLSLIARVRNGALTSEMRGERSAAARLLPYARHGGNGWSDPFRPAVAALQVEGARLFAIASEAGQAAQRVHDHLFAQLQERDRVIASLQPPATQPGAFR
jgi:hypothetical protein